MFSIRIKFEAEMLQICEGYLIWLNILLQWLTIIHSQFIQINAMN